MHDYMDRFCLIILFYLGKERALLLLLPAVLETDTLKLSRHEVGEGGVERGVSNPFPYSGV